MTAETLLTIDPGVHHSGFALWDSDCLTDAWLQKTVCSGPKRWLQRPLDHVLIEVPEIYSARHLKGDPRDLVDVAFQAGAWWGEIKTLPSRGDKLRLTTIYPKKWKKQVPKAIMVERIKLMTTQTERDRICRSVPASLMHNVWDAIGIGLWHHKRLP